MTRIKTYSAVALGLEVVALALATAGTFAGPGPDGWNTASDVAAAFGLVALGAALESIRRLYRP